ncbi:hypothetical protein ACMA1I_22510 [Pontibacter sp. 13R65]|uniref:hypothetical protein n=1 Tax=Pontibacter sp. 13R65 TaxID=3127458 RepID=UPI00301CA37F
MIEEYLTKEDFERGGGSMTVVAFISTFILMIVFVEYTQSRYLIPVLFVIPFLSAHVASYLGYRKWRQEMLATGHVTAERFDELARKYKISSRQLYSAKGLLSVGAVTFVLSTFSFYLRSQEIELKLYGKETVGTVEEIRLTLSGKHSNALIGFDVKGEKYTTTLRINGSSLGVDATYRIKGNPLVKLGDTLLVIYSTVDPENNRVILEGLEKN